MPASVTTTYFFFFAVVGGSVGGMVVGGGGGEATRSTGDPVGSSSTHVRPGVSAIGTPKTLRNCVGVSAFGFHGQFASS